MRRCLLFPIIAVLLFLTSFVRGAGAEPFPFSFTFEQVSKVKEKQLEYGMLKELKEQHYGVFWQQEYSFAGKLENTVRFEQMAEKIRTALQKPGLAFNRWGYAHFEQAGSQYVLLLKAYQTSAQLSVLQLASYTPFLHLGAPQWNLEKKLSQKGVDAPLLSIAPSAAEIQVKRLVYKNYEEQVFRAKKASLEAKGAYWLLEYGLKKYTKINSLRYRATHNYRQLLEQEGATIFMGGDSAFLFELNDQDKHYVGRFEGYDNSMKLQVVEEEPFHQSLVLSPDKLKAALELDGKVTLEGIYFDTDKATLKAESSRAILAAASLMLHYPDLVLEVQGHTDSQGKDAYNLDLSRRRAAAVVDALVAQGVEASRLRSQGFGEQVPVADNATEAGRATNRRVELHRISGGTAVRQITIDFIKPLPGAVLKQKYQYSNAKLTIMHTTPYSATKQAETIIGSSSQMYKYVMQREGKRDTSFSPIEIITNYRNVLPLMGAELLGERSNSLFFQFVDRGDGQPLYGVIRAYEGTYEIRTYLR